MTTPTSTQTDAQKSTQNEINQYWEDLIIPPLMEYIEIPAKSPAFDPDWKKNGYLDQALKLAEDWIESREIPGIKKEVLRMDGRTPLLLLTIPGAKESTVLMYGHMDKQPEMTGWSEGLSPWKAVRRDDKIYGRGGADDGYAVFASLCAVEMLMKKSTPLPTIVVAIEFCEESGSGDLPYYFETYSAKFGTPELVICLDSGAGNYDQLWNTTSLRGIVNGTLTVKVLNEGVHSGKASGIVPDSFRLARLLLDRLEHAESGEVFSPELSVKIPEGRIQEAAHAAEALEKEIYTQFPFAGATRPTTNDLQELVLRQTWKASLTVTGADGLPEPKKAGNVLRPQTTLKISLRLPPTLDSKKAAEFVSQTLTRNPPLHAEVSFELEDTADGWNAPAIDPKIDSIVQDASRAYFQLPAVSMGEGGSIPFMGMLGKKFPRAQFLITGVLGPQSNAHGPNEFIHVEYAKRLTACVQHVLSQI